MVVVRNRAVRGRRLSRDLTGRSPVGNAYPATMISFGAGTNPTAPLFARNDCDPTDTTTAAGIPNMFPREPMLARTKAGTILAVCEAHEANSDAGISHFLLRRSRSNGYTWGSCIALGRIPSFAANSKWGNAAVILPNQFTGKVHFFYTQSTGAAGVATDNAAIQAMYTSSTDDALTWSAPVDRSAEFKGVAQGWWIAGPGHGCQIQRGTYKGRLLVPIVYRTSNDISGTAFSQVMYSDDDGVSWTLGGPNMGNAANNDSLEWQITEWGTAGALLGVARRKSGDWICFTRSTDGGATWDDFLDYDGQSGRTALGLASAPDAVGGDCQIGLSSTPSGSTVYLSRVIDTVIRARLAVYVSTDGGATFPTKKVIDDHRCAYSDLLCLDEGSILAAWEMIQDQLNFNGDSLTQCQYIRCARIGSLHFGTSGTPRFYEWLFNEVAIAASFSTLGQGQVYDRGGNHVNAIGNTTNTATRGAADGVLTNGSGPGMILTRTQEDGSGTDSGLGSELAPQLDESWTMELAGLKVTQTGFKALMDDRNGSNDGQSLTIAVTTHKLSFAMNDLAGAVISDVAINDSARHDVRVVLNADTDICSMYIDGSVQGTPRAMVFDATSGRGVQPFMLGGRQSGTSSAIFDCLGIKITRGLVTSGFFTAASIATKQTVDQFLGHTVTVPATAPTLVSGASYVGLSTFDDGRGGRLDRWAGWDHGVLPKRPGDGIAAYRDLIGNLRADFGASNFRGAWWDEDAAMGRHWRLSRSATATGYLRILAADVGTSLDYIQETGVFTFAVKLCFVATTGAAQYVFDNHTGSAATPGFHITRDDATHFTVVISDGSGTAVVSKQFTIASMSFGTWYHLAVTGDGTTLRFYWTAYPGGRASATLAAAQTQAYTSATWLAETPPRSHHATGVWAFGSRNDDAGGSDLRAKDILFASTCLNTAALQADMDFGPAY